MHLRPPLVLVLACAGLAACSTITLSGFQSRYQLERELQDSLSVSLTNVAHRLTQEELVTQAGQPDHKQALDDGSEIWSYRLHSLEQTTEKNWSPGSRGDAGTIESDTVDSERPVTDEYTLDVHVRFDPRGVMTNDWAFDGHYNAFPEHPLMTLRSRTVNPLNVDLGWSMAAASGPAADHTGRWRLVRAKTVWGDEYVSVFGRPLPFEVVIEQENDWFGSRIADGQLVLYSHGTGRASVGSWRMSAGNAGRLKTVLSNDGRRLRAGLANGDTDNWQIMLWFEFEADVVPPDPAAETLAHSRSMP